MSDIKLSVGGFTVDVPNYFSPSLVFTKMVAGPQRVELSNVQYALLVLDTLLKERGMDAWYPFRSLSSASRISLANAWLETSNKTIAMGVEEPDIVY